MEYVHGGDIYTHKGMTDFSVNLNPFGPGRAVVEAARKSIDQIGNYKGLYSAISCHFQHTKSFFRCQFSLSV